MHTNIQHQFDTINAVSETAFKVVNGLIELTEDIIVEGYDENGNIYTFAGATPAEIITLNGVHTLYKLSSITSLMKLIQSTQNSMYV